MLSQSDRQFPHRLNGDGSYDSICTTCFRTVATAHSEEELAAEERMHECAGPPSRLPTHLIERAEQEA
jgi:hypothetical protein